MTLGGVRSLLTLAALPILSGCVALVLPLVAAGTMGKTQIDRTKAKKAIVAEGALDVSLEKSGEAVAAVLPAPHIKGDFTERGFNGRDFNGQDFNGRGGALDAGSPDDTDGPKDYLSRAFNRLESLRTSPYAEFTNFALSQSAKMEAGEGISSTVLQPRVDIGKPKTISCGGKPLAVLIDMDDVQNPDWAGADTLYRQDGLIEALNSLRVAEISVIWLSDKPVQASGRIASILKEARLSAPKADDFIFLDRGGEDRKQARRWGAARNYCIVAMAGDERADFDELYDYLRDPDGAITLEHMFGNGWFLTPPPLVVNAGSDPAESDEPEEDEG